MIDEIDQRLETWVHDTIEGAVVSLVAPRESEDKRAVGLYLMDILHSLPVGSSRRVPLQASLRYLVTTWSKSPQEAHHMLGMLVFAAMEHTEFEVELAPIPAQLWQAFGVVPRPAFMFRLPLRMERPESNVKRVLAPLAIRYSRTTSISGVVMGSRDLPIPDARVEFCSLGLATHTDTKGRFRFANVPVEPRARRLRVQAKGKELYLTLEQPSSEAVPIVIHFDVMEV